MPLRAWLLLLLLSSAHSFTGFTFSHVFKFPNVAYDQGVHGILSPEYLTCCKPVIVPGFEVVQASAPVLCRNYTMVEFTFRTLLGPAHARMMTDRASQNHVILSRLNSLGVPDTPVCALSLDVTREGMRGHSMRLRGQTYGDTPVWARVVMGMLMQPSVWEHLLRWGYIRQHTNVNLETYRFQVMAKDRLPVQ